MVLYALPPSVSEIRTLRLVQKEETGNLLFSEGPNQPNLSRLIGKQMMWTYEFLPGGTQIPVSKHSCFGSYQ